MLLKKNLFCYQFVKKKSSYCYKIAVKIRKKSRVPGVMITQYVEELPEGMTTPDFTRKPIALTIPEGNIEQCFTYFFIIRWYNNEILSAMCVGKMAFFRAIVTGNPTPKVSWARNNGEIDEERYKFVFDPVSGEHQLQVQSPISQHCAHYDKNCTFPLVKNSKKLVFL